MQHQTDTRFPDAAAADYDRRILTLVPGYQFAQALLTATLAQTLPNDATLLLAGCGTGSELAALATANASCWRFSAVEPSAGMLAAARAKAAGYAQRGGVLIGAALYRRRWRQTGFPAAVGAAPLPRRTAAAVRLSTGRPARQPLPTLAAKRRAFGGAGAGGDRTHPPQLAPDGGSAQPSSFGRKWLHRASAAVRCAGLPAFTAPPPSLRAASRAASAAKTATRSG